MNPRTRFYRVLILLLLLVLFLSLLPSPGLLVLAGGGGSRAEEASSYTISGQVTDSEGQPVQGVMITARPEAGKIVVKDEGGNPVSGAQVFRNGLLAGTTEADGTLTVEDLAMGDELVARQLVTEVPTSKNNHSQDSSQNWGYRVYITSLDIPTGGEPAPLVVSDPAAEQTLVIRKDNTLIGFNIVASTEWDATMAYLAELQEGFENASHYLYDASDGQMLFERVTIYDDNQNMGDADYQVRASNQEWPRANVNGLLSSDNLHVFLGRYFDGASANQGSWANDNGYRTQIHEFGHYGLGLYDSYFYYDKGEKKDGHCTSAAIRWNTTPNINATLMDYQYNTTEFAMRNVSGLWSTDCERTDQWKRNGASDWETIVAAYENNSTPAQWELKTPAAHNGVVAGPTSIPVVGWTTVEVGHDANTGVCDPPPTYVIEHLWGSPATGADVVLRGNDRDIRQGKTDEQGEITILGAANGDRIVVNLWGIDLRINSTEVACSTTYRSQAARDSTIVLQPAAFELTIGAFPGDQPDQITIQVKAAAQLSAEPIVRLTQNGADSVQVPLAYEGASQSYSGSLTLRTDLPRSGILVATATDLQQQEVQVVSAFNLSKVLRNEDITIWSSDGQAELYIPAGSLSADGQISVEPAQIASDIPQDLRLISGPYALQAGAGVTLSGTANLALYYLDLGGSLDHVDISTAQLYQWQGSQWQPLASTVSQQENVVSAAIDALSSYALLAERREKVYLPLVVRRASQSVASEPEDNDQSPPFPQDDINLSASGQRVATPAVRVSATYTATTDGSGNYALSGLPVGTFTLTPAQAGQCFSPRSLTVTLPPDASGQDFVVTSCGEMVFVPAGEFQMGCDNSNPNESCYSTEQPLHTVYLDAYYIDKYEVTNAQYAQFLNAEGNQEEGGVTWLDANDADVRIHQSGGIWQADADYEDHPVVEVSWYGGRAYCQWQNKRLPTEAEWEKAARGSSDTRMYPWGDTAPDCSRLNYSDSTAGLCVGDTSQVGSYPSGASRYGALDMAGNVWEWVNDWYDSGYYAVSPYSNPPGPASGSYKVLRGGGWYGNWYGVRAAFRSDYYNPDNTGNYVGFRCVVGSPGG